MNGMGPAAWGSPYFANSSRPSNNWIQNPDGGRQLPTAKPPKKRQRSFDGEVLDVSSVAATYFGGSRRTVENQVARKLIPFKRLGGRIIFLKTELNEFFSRLDGVSVEDAIRHNQERTS